MASNTNEAYNRAMGGMGSDYNMLSADSDTGIGTIAKLLTELFGGQQQAFKDVAVALQRLAGIDNKGAAMGGSILGGIQNFGAPGLTPGGGVGMIGGRDVASFYAARAVQNQMLNNYVDPTTGMIGSRARGLDQAQLGQAAELAMRSGAMFNNGIPFQANNVTEEYKRNMMNAGIDQINRTGNRRDYEDALKLKVGTVHTTLTDAGKQSMDKAMDDATATLASIKDVMGGESLKNLEKTMSDLFGGSASDFGLRAARMRMIQVKAMAENYGGGPQGAATAAAALSAQGDIVNSGNRLVDMHAAIFSERMGIAGGKAAASNAGTALGAGFAVSPATHQEISNNVATDVGKISKEETEVTAMLSVMQMIGGGTAEQKKEMKRLLDESVNAGSDEDKVTAAREKIREFTTGLTGTNAENLGINLDGSDLTGEYAETKASHSTRSLASRSPGLLREDFRKNKLFHRAGMDFTADEAEALGMGAINMGSAARQQLEEILNGDPANRGAGIDAWLEKNKNVAEDLGADKDKFLELVRSGRVTTKQLEAFNAYKNGVDRHKGYMGAADARQGRLDEYQTFVRSNINGEANRGDAVEELMKGMHGVRSWTDQEKMDLLTASGKVTKLDLNDSSQIKGSDQNLAKLKALLGPEKMRQLGIPDDPAAASAWISQNADTLGMQLKTDYGMSIAGGKMNLASLGDLDMAGERLSEQAWHKELSHLTGKGIKRRAGESDAELSKRAQEQLRVSMNNGKLLDDTILAAAEGFGKYGVSDSEYKTGLFVRDQLDEGGKARWDESIAKQQDELRRQLNSTQERLKGGAQGEERKALEEKRKTLTSQLGGLSALAEKAMSGGQGSSIVCNSNTVIKVLGALNIEKDLLKS